MHVHTVKHKTTQHNTVGFEPTPTYIKNQNCLYAKYPHKGKRELGNYILHVYPGSVQYVSCVLCRHLAT